MPRPLRILLVEDDADDVLLFQRRCPPEFVVEPIAEAGAALVRLRRGAVDLCFTDYRLGGGSGLELIQSARAEGLRTPFVVITGQDVETLGENALLAGATDFLPKDALSPATLHRVARWALIRRHVENRHEDAPREELLRRLFGQPPSPAALGPFAGQEPELRRIVYASQARRLFTQPELLALCAGFATANARSNVTGVLVQAGNCFVQALEGSEQTLEVLIRRIRADPRHGDMAIIVDQRIERRAFLQWSMGCFLLHLRYELSPSHWLRVLADCNRLLEADGASRDSLAALIRSLPDLLARTAATGGDAAQSIRMRSPLPLVSDSTRTGLPR